MIPTLGLDRAVVVIVVLIAVFSAGAAASYRITGNSYRAAAAAAAEAAQAAYRAQALKLNDAAAALEAAKNEKQIVYRTINKNVARIIDRPVYRNVCLDDDGLRNIEAARRGIAADPRQPAPAMPAAGLRGRENGR